MNSTPTPAALGKGRHYDETFRVPAGALCLDFCNTGQAMRDARAVEWLPEFGDLIDWLEAAAAISHAQASRLRRAGRAAPAAASAAWRRAILLREALFRVFDAAARGEAAMPADLDHIARTYFSCMSASAFEWRDGRYAWQRESAAASLPAATLHPVIASAVELLSSEKLASLRRCGSPTCHWLFLDETRNHSRRWCEMASCGNLAKVRRHRQKGRAARPG